MSTSRSPLFSTSFLKLDDSDSNRLLEMLAVGIDFGTTNSSVAYSGSGGKVTVIEIEQSARSIPSCVAFTTEERLVGQPALHQLGKNASNTVLRVKRLLGRNNSDQPIEEPKRAWPVNFKSVDGKQKIQVQYRGKRRSFYPEEVAATILTRIEEIAVTGLQQPVAGAVFTVPDSFNFVQRQAIKDAADIAGIPVFGLLNETIAAAISYGQRSQVQSKTVLIFHLGGGSFDATLLTIENGVYNVRAKSGSTRLGGDDFTDNLLTKCCQSFEADNNTNLGNNPEALARLWKACVKAKEDLSLSNMASVKVDALYSGIDFEFSISESDFKSLNEHLLQRMRKIIDGVYTKAQIEKYMVDDIVIVGAATRMKMVQNLFGEYGEEKIRKTINTNEAVVLGAAIYAAYLAGKRPERFVIYDPLPHDVKVKYGGVENTLFEKGSSIPIFVWRTVDNVDENEASSFDIKVYRKNSSSDEEHGDGYRMENVTHGATAQQHAATKFEITANGILQVTDHYIGGGMVVRSHSTRIDVEKLGREAVGYQNDDKRHNEIARELHKLEKYAYEVQSEIRGKEDISDPTKQRLMQECDDIIDWIQITPRIKAEDHQNNDDRRKEVANELHELEKFAFDVQSEVQVEKGSSAKTSQKMSQECDDMINWIQTAPNAQKEDITLRRKRLEEIRSQRLKPDGSEHDDEKYGDIARVLYELEKLAVELQREIETKEGISTNVKQMLMQECDDIIKWIQKTPKEEILSKRKRLEELRSQARHARTLNSDHSSVGWAQTQVLVETGPVPSPTRDGTSLGRTETQGSNWKLWLTSSPKKAWGETDSLVKLDPKNYGSENPNQDKRSTKYDGFISIDDASTEDNGVGINPDSGCTCKIL